MMKTFALALAFLLLPALAAADDAPTERSGEQQTIDARLVPLVRDGVFVGLKVYAIKPGGRFDQPTARFRAGDTIEQIDGEAVTTDAGTRALHDKVVRGTADATVTVRRAGTLVTLYSKARSTSAAP